MTNKTYPHIDLIDIYYPDAESGFDINVAHLKIKEGPFEGVVYTYGAVSFPDEKESLLRFEYDIVMGDVGTKLPEFEKLVGDILLDIIRRGLEEKSIVYSGGTG